MTDYTICLDGLRLTDPLAVLAMFGAFVDLNGCDPSLEPKLHCELIGPHFVPVITTKSKLTQDSLSEILRGYVRRGGTCTGHHYERLQVPPEIVPLITKNRRLAVTRSPMIAHRALIKHLSDCGCMPEVFSFSDTGDAPRELYREIALRAFDRYLEQQTHASAFDGDFLSALCCDGVLERSDNPSAIPGDYVSVAPFRIGTGGSGRYMMADLRELYNRITAEKIKRSLFLTWDWLRDTGFSMCWSPAENRSAARTINTAGAPGAPVVEDTAKAKPKRGKHKRTKREEFDEKSKDKVPTMHGANLLAIEAFPLFTSMSINGETNTICWRRIGKNIKFCWPIWTRPLTLDQLKALLNTDLVSKDLNSKRVRDKFSVEHVFTSAMIRPNRNLVMNRARAVV